jgi:hypothetical protein
MGGHPVDTRVAAGTAWDDQLGAHTHYYPPVDMRLFSFRDGCYTFIGDPVDFGYRGEVTSYYGAHPMLDAYGGGWCFMIGAHAHAFQPWSPSFVVVGPWYYWRGTYDATFWSYWPYYSYYYRNYYPRYYAGGRFWRNHDYRVAPPLRRLPPAAYAGRGRGGNTRPGTPPSWHATPPPAAPTQQWRGTPPAAGGVQVQGGWRGSPPATPQPVPRATTPYVAPSGGWTGTPAAGRIQAAPAPAPHRTGPSVGGHAGSGVKMRR